MSSPRDDSSITSVKDLFTYHIFGTPGHLSAYAADTSQPFVTVSGLVDRPLHLSLDRIRREFEPVTAPMVLQCMTNVHWGRIRFTGARVADVLAAAGPTDSAIKLALRAEDGFTTGIRIDEVRQEPDAYLLAYAMNADGLDLEHGFPLRFTADGKYGYKWPKWLREIEVVDHDFKGHYEGRRGWSDDGVRGKSVTR